MCRLQHSVKTFNGNYFGHKTLIRGKAEQFSPKEKVYMKLFIAFLKTHSTICNTKLLLYIISRENYFFVRDKQLIAHRFYKIYQSHLNYRFQNNFFVNIISFNVCLYVFFTYVSRVSFFPHSFPRNKQLISHCVRKIYQLHENDNLNN